MQPIIFYFTAAGQGYTLSIPARPFSFGLD